MEKIIVSAAAILGTLIAFKFKGLLHKVISIGLTTSVLLIWTGDKHIIAGSFLIMITLAITTFVYGLTVKDLTNLEKISITTMGFFLTIGSVFKLLHYQGVGLIRLAMIVPIIITLATFIKIRQLTKEMSFIIFWLVYAMTEFLRNWTIIK